MVNIGDGTNLSAAWDAAALDDIAQRGLQIRMLHLSRNYGQTAALMAAIRNNSGDVVVPMDGDGQNDPAHRQARRGL
jgi:glycosyltransferase involved in cell wall biosynthesis